MKERIRVPRPGTVSRKIEPSSAGISRPPAGPEVVPPGGSPLDPGTQSTMETRFGHDFSQVRVHTDAQADASARALDALAFTAGRDVMFRQGQYAPETPPGRRLLAHELTHVVQQGAGDVPPGTLQRSLAGAVVGGVIGGVAGFFAAGPYGAAAGAGIGAAMGEEFSTTSRPLSGDEIAYARTIFADSLDYAAITITRGSSAAVGGTARTLGNTINMDDEEFAGDTLDFSPGGMDTLIHEMTHVWQYQHHGWTYAPEALWAQAKAAWQTGSRSAAYDWRTLDGANTPWEDWNPEAQAEAVEDYNKALRRAFDGTASLDDYGDLDKLGKYIVKMQGAPSPKGDFEPLPPPAGPDSALA